jgi:hypothetical protein
LALNRYLYPDLERYSKKTLEFNNFDMVPHARPVMIPADNAITVLGIVLVCSEVTRSKLKFDLDQFLSVASVTVGNTVGVSSPYFFDSELQLCSDAREQVYNTKLVL